MRVWLAEKAEADGLQLDWACLPDRATLDALAPTHDSCSGSFLLDSFRRTWREVAGQPCHVGLTESLYAPLGPDGARLKPINEAIHASARSRFGKAALTCTNDDSGATSSKDYRPNNLQPFFGAQAAQAMIAS